MERLELLEGDRRNAFGRAFAWVTIRMVAIQAPGQLVTGQRAGALLLVFETGEQLVLDPHQGVYRERRFAHHFSEQLERRFALVRCAEAAQRGNGHVAISTVAEVCTQALEATGDGAYVLALHAFVEH